MNYYENPRLAKIYIERDRDMIEGRRSMPEITYEPRGDSLHLSDVGDLCLLQPFFRRTMSYVPPLDTESLVVFTRGRVFERAIAIEGKPICVDGIWMTIDDAEPPDPFKIVEIKSTEWGMHFFDPVEKTPQWIERGMGYCYGHGVTEMGLVVFFLSGNKPDFQPRRGESYPPKGTPIIKGGVRAWTLEFTQEELDANWLEMLRRKDLLISAIESGTPIDDNEILARLPVRVWKNGKKNYWLCNGCRFRGMCHITAWKEFGVPAVA